MIDNIEIKVDRFEFEQQIHSCWNITEDIKTIYESYDQREVSQDEIQNALLGLMTIYGMKFEKLFSMFEQMVSQRKIV